MRITNTLSAVAGSTVDAPSLSVNFVFANDGADKYFIDQAKQARCWTGNGSGFSQSSGDIDDRGYLVGMDNTTTESAVFFLSAWTDPDQVAQGEFTMTWEGQMDGPVTPSGQITNLVIDYVAKTATFDIAYWSGNTYFACAGIHGLDPPRDFVIVRTDQLPLYNAGVIWQPKWIEPYKDKLFEVRTMDIARTNFNQVANWADRITNDTQTWGGINGCSLEAQRAIATELNCALWYCVPHLATDDMMTQTATWLDNNTPVGEKVSIEFSNEVWNWTFSTDSGGNVGQTLYSYNQSVALWGAENTQSWYAMRFVQMCKLFKAVSATRFSFVLGGQMANEGLNSELLDAAVWYANDPTPHETPHSHADFLTVADYIGAAAADFDAVFTVFDAVHDTGDHSTANDAFYQMCLSNSASGSAELMAKLDDHNAFNGVADTIDSTVRDFNIRCYEGGSNHFVPYTNQTGKWFIPILWVTGVAVIEDEFRINSWGRMYQATGAGTTGATEPTHTNAGSVSDGTVTWLDVTGVERDSGGSLVRAEAGGAYCNGMLAWTSSMSLTAGDVIENSNGTVYVVNTTGTGGATEPVQTYTTGEQTIDGISYTAHRMGLWERMIRPELHAWWAERIGSSDMADAHIRVFNYEKTQGFGSTAIFSHFGGSSYGGSFGNYLDATDYGPNRTREKGDMLMNWSKANPVWW